jgi:replicative DNA helicase
MVSDVAAERGLLAALVRGGYAAFCDADGLVKSAHFTTEPAQVLFKCLERAYRDDDRVAPDASTILSAAGACGLGEFFNAPDHMKYLRGVLNLPADGANAKRLARKVVKLATIRDLSGVLELAASELKHATGDESLAEVVGRVEQRVLDFGRAGDDAGPVRLGLGAGEYLDRVMVAGRPLGIPTGFARWDAAIGGGLLPNSLDLVGARTKVGKSMFGLAVMLNVASMGVPVLYVDTEMTREEQIRRLASSMAQVPERLIRDGRLGERPDTAKAVRSVYRRLEALPIDHLCAAQKTLSQIIGDMRRWMLGTVGLQPDGAVKPCLVVYDYFKLTSAGDISKSTAEYQAMGFMATEVKNLMAKYQGRCLAFVQLNRQAIEREDETAIAQSDRLAWFCTSFSRLAWLPDEYRAKLVDQKYTHQLRPVFSRHGGRFRDGDFIHVAADLRSCRMVEGATKYELEHGTEAFPEDTDF